MERQWLLLLGGVGEGAEFNDLWGDDGIRGPGAVGDSGDLLTSGDTWYITLCALGRRWWMRSFCVAGQEATCSVGRAGSVLDLLHVHAD